MREVRPIDANALFDALRDSEFQTLCPLDEVDDVIAAAPTIDCTPKQQWISVEERLPEPDENVLYYEYGSEIDVMPSEWIREQYYEGYYKIYWMPLPEPPKEG